MKEVVELRITHFRFAIGGEHYYGKFRVRTKYERIIRDGKAYLSSRSGAGVARHPNDDHSIRRPMTAKEALYLSKKDGNEGTWAYKRGELTTRFDDEQSIIKVAKKVFPTLFDEADILVTESLDKSELRQPRDLLIGPSEIAKFFKNNRDSFKQDEFLMQQGYLLKEPAPDQ